MGYRAERMEGGKGNLVAGGRNLGAVKIATDTHGQFLYKGCIVCVCRCVSVANHIKNAEVVMRNWETYK